MSAPPLTSQRHEPFTDDEKRRYARHFVLREIGGQGQQKLKSARVCVVGAGGLGAPIIQYLAGAGVGTLSIIDPDTVEVSNLHRQTIFKESDVGQPKADAAAAYVNALNPNVRTQTVVDRVADDNAIELFSGADLIIEGVDSFEARFVINRAAIKLKIPLVSAAVSRFQGVVGCFSPWVTIEDKRTGLRVNSPCYRCFTPEAPPREEILTCADEGVLGPAVGVIGSIAAVEAIKAITGAGQNLIGRIIIYDGLSGDTRTVALPADPACPDCGMQNAVT
ncbi:MAG: HesA/MoeB/ThiF family protein [Pseudomonadota bacterium]